MEISQFLKAVGMSEEDVLVQVTRHRDRSMEFVRAFRDQLQEDKNLLMNVKRDKEMIGDSTLFNVHTNLMARSYKSKPSISFRKTKEGIEQEVKMLNACLVEDMGTTEMKAMKYTKDWYKYWAGFAAALRTGWDGVYKRNKFELVNPINVVFDPNGDYFTGNFQYVGFDRIMTEQQFKDEGFKNWKDLPTGESTEDGAIRYQRDTQMEKDLNPLSQRGEYDVYLHFDHFNGTKGWVYAGGNGTKILKAGIVEAGDSVQEKNPEAIAWPVNFWFWKPIPDIPTGDRPANYARDVQVTQSKLANLRLKKAQAELYPMYFYNKDYVNGKDLSFGFNKGIPVSTGLEGPQVNMNNLIAPIQKDLRIDTTNAIEQSLNAQLEKSLGIGAIAGGSTPERRETAKTNSLIMDSLDILISLNEDVDLIGEEQFVRQWYYGYYVNFEDADKKLVFASSGTQTIPVTIKRKDFIIDGNLSIDIESSSETEMRKNRARVNFANYYTLLQSNPDIPSISKLIALRELGSFSDVPEDVIENIVAKTPQEMEQEMENEMLKKNMYVDIKPTDDHMTHLLCIPTTAEYDNEATALHRLAHMRAYSESGQQNLQTPPNQQIASQAMAQIGGEQAALNSQLTV